ncbi:lysine transporter LysE [Acrocarpospora corrugata]|uniref:Lysine transporter LysE n=1 Tax=Acrocarpospora corrugata TaxID=35763 RepID=A0A5M3W7T1_9ACTN|nr:LysE family translocator [Acrocarpospora corrugata]GES05117.1 lysine transporter LysE [Acrocarpospora corrugata]
MAVSSVLAFWVVALLLIVVPGADWAFTISAGLRGRSVYPAVSGLVAGYAAVTLVVAAGVGALVAANPAVLTGLTLIGGLYLIWHGVTTFARLAVPAATAEDPAGTDWNIFLRGVGVSGLNPKGLLIFLALLPQFTDPRAAWPIAAQIGVLGLAFMATCGLFYAGVGQLTRTLLHGRPAAARLIGRLSGAAMIGIGAWLLLTNQG